MQYKDYYAVLGVPKTASKQEVQKAYRRLARKYHPDVNQEKAAEDRFKEVSEAYDVLSDTEKRGRYDQFGSEWQRARTGGGAGAPGFDDFFKGFTGGQAGGRPGGFGGGQTVRDFEFGDQGFSSFFEMLFGGATPRARTSGGRGPQAAPGSWSQDGSNVEASIKLPLEQAAHGGQREITLNDPQTGRPKTLRVTLPPALQPGKKIRLAGQGAQGIGSGKSGDLFLAIEIASHPQFRLEGNDLHLRLEVTPWEAALGQDVEIPTLDGKIRIRVPEGTSSGRKIRLRGKGYPISKGGHGDLFAELSIAVPTPLSDREKELFEQLAETSEFNPRSSN